MQEIPLSIGVVSFVAGLVLLIAALVGQKIEIAAVKLPEMVDPKRRAASAALGAALVAFGLLDSRPPASPPPTTVPVSAPATATAPALPAVRTASDTSATSGVLRCLAGVAPGDVFAIPVEPDLRTDRKFSTGQPREGVIAIQFTSAGAAVGAVTFRTLSSGLGFRIHSVVDGACAPVAAYANVSNPGAPNTAAANYETLEYRFPAATVRMDMAYCEDRDCIALRAQQMAH